MYEVLEGFDRGAMLQVELQEELFEWHGFAGVGQYNSVISVL